MGIMRNVFDYNKPGRGVDKHGPKKKGVLLFWEIFTNKFWSFIPLSVLYLLCSVLVLTNGLAEAGITYVTRNFSRQKPVMLVSDFFDTIKKNWKQALAVGIINLVVTAVLCFAMFFYYSGWNSSVVYKIGLVISGCIFIVFSFLKYYIYYLLVTFRLTTKQLYKNSLLLSSAGLKQNVIITVSLLATYGFFFGLPTAYTFIAEDALLAIIFMILSILFLPAIRSLIIQFCVFPVIKEKMIDPYYEAHPEAKKDKALLNLMDDEEGEEEAVFTDRGSSEVVDPGARVNEPSFPQQYSKKDIKRMRRRQDSDYDDTI